MTAALSKAVVNPTCVDRSNPLFSGRHLNARYWLLISTALNYIQHPNYRTPGYRHIFQRRSKSVCSQIWRYCLVPKSKMGLLTLISEGRRRWQAIGVAAKIVDHAMRTIGFARFANVAAM